MGAIENLAFALEQRRSWDEVLALSHRQLALDNLREESHRRLMRVLARQGMPEAALQQYDTLRNLLLTEMGVEPDQITNELVRQISTGQQDETQTVDATKGTRPAPPRSDWSQAPVVGNLYGRTAEAELLQGWLVDEQCQLVALLGMGGVGKSTLAAHLAHKLAGRFDVVRWYSLQNGLPLDELLARILIDLTLLRRTELPATLDGQLALLLEQLRTWRCLLVLDNVETILQQTPDGDFLPGYGEYHQLFELFGVYAHQSSLLLTSRERPKNLRRLAR